jgi:hypothetical protein
MKANAFLIVGADDVLDEIPDQLPGSMDHVPRSTDHVPDQQILSSIDLQ